MQNRQVNSIREVDFSGLGMPCIAVYKNPNDFPGKSVARIFDLGKPTDTIMVRDSLLEIAEDIQRHTGMVFIPREKEDAPSLIGVWM